METLLVQKVHTIQEAHGQNAKKLPESKIILGNRHQFKQDVRVTVFLAI